jgi:L-alanine-DL-glutamate epimerase-like enolase superfamily enzyme
MGETERIEYRAPIKFGGRVVRDVALFKVQVVVETRDGRRGLGSGCMPMGNAWAWPSDTLAPGRTLEAMVTLAGAGVELADAYSRTGHPLEIMRELSDAHRERACHLRSEIGEEVPRLAQLVALSPLDAALHDAYGKALGENAFNLLGSDFVEPDLAHWLGAEFVGEYLDRYTLRAPKPRMPLYHLVGALDPLRPEEIGRRLDDGLPETLGEWIQADGLTHLKIKLDGGDLEWDVDRVASVEAVADPIQRARGCGGWWYSLDFNERCSSSQYVLDFLARLQERNPAALARIQYIEQPTHRDLRSHPENRMHEVSKVKPVVIDESLVDMESLLLSREMGYSGVALKSCKGHTEALLMGAAAQKLNLFLCVQDLTCPGASFLHSAALAARIPTVAAIEGNARQYCPAGNRDWSDRFPSMFRISDGTVGTFALTGPGLGF